MQSKVVYKRDYWKTENLNYARPHLRLKRIARLINRIAQGREVDLLDVGCGPATLRHHLQKNVHYHGIDIAIHEPSPDLLETDFVENPIKFENKRFDLIVAQGVFEYVGAFQQQKFAEIAQLLNPGGTFIASYNNFDHLNKHISPAYSNIQTISEFKQELSCFFNIQRSFPTAHHWRHREPGRKWSKGIQMIINMHIPYISTKFALQYIFVCRRASTKGL